jgi:aminoglycoside phosphotransferase (APT) family kinase protein
VGLSGGALPGYRVGVHPDPSLEQALQRLAPVLAPILAPGATGVAGVIRLTGGASLQTWRFHTTGVERACILRRREAAGENALPLSTEAALLRAAAAAGVQVPAVLRDCAAADGLGEALITSYIAGETLGRRIVAGEAFAAVRPGLARQAGAALARIHAIKTGALPALPVADAAATLAQYDAIFRRTGACRPVLELALRWLGQIIPPAMPCCLVHGDFRTGNLIIDPATGLAAVLDWELAHLGDAAEDIGWLCVNAWRFGAIDRVAGGFGSLAELLAGYADAGGAPPDLSRIRYWQMLGSLKWAIMCLMMFESSAAAGTVSLERAAIGRRVSESEADLLALIDGAA